MDLLNRTVAKLSDVVRSLSPRARLTAALLLVLLLIGAAYLVVLQAHSPKIDLLGGHTFSVTEMHAAQIAFGKAGLNDFEVEAARIKVPRHKHDVYLAALSDARVLSPDFNDYLMKTIKEQSPWTGSRLHDRALLAAHQRVLSDSISQMQGIETAHVFISVLDKPNFRGQRLVTASVDVKTVDNRPLDSRQVRAIRSLVAGGTAGLKRHQITVVDSTGRAFPGTDHSGLDDFDEAYFALQEAFEQRYEEAILSVLSHVPGASVSVHVELTLNQRPATTTAATGESDGPNAETTSPPEQLAHAANTQAALEHAAGTDPPQPDTPGLAGVRTASEAVRQPDYLPSRVTASVTLPNSSLDDLASRSPSPPAGHRGAEAAKMGARREEVRQQIQRQVLTVIPHEPSADPARLVSVNGFDPIPTSMAKADPSAQHAAPRRSLTPGQKIGLCALAVAALLMLWSWLPSGKSIDDVTARSTKSASAGVESSPLHSLPSRLGSTGDSVRAELADVVRENPDAAAHILRTWIGNAS